MVTRNTGSGNGVASETDGNRNARKDDSEETRQGGHLFAIGWLDGIAALQSPSVALRNTAASDEGGGRSSGCEKSEEEGSEDESDFREHFVRWKSGW